MVAGRAAGQGVGGDGKLGSCTALVMQCVAFVMMTPVMSSMPKATEVEVEGWNLALVV